MGRSITLQGVLSCLFLFFPDGVFSAFYIGLWPWMDCVRVDSNGVLRKSLAQSVCLPQFTSLGIITF